MAKAYVSFEVKDTIEHAVDVAICLAEKLKAKENVFGVTIRVQSDENDEHGGIHQTMQLYNKSVSGMFSPKLMVLLHEGCKEKTIRLFGDSLKCLELSNEVLIVDNVFRSKVSSERAAKMLINVLQCCSMNLRTVHLVVSRKVDPEIKRGVERILGKQKVHVNWRVSKAAPNHLWLNPINRKGVVCGGSLGMLDKALVSVVKLEVQKVNGIIEKIGADA